MTTRNQPAYIKMEEVGVKAAERKPIVPRLYEFSPLLIRQIFRRVELSEKSTTGQVHVMLFRRCMRRLFDIFDPQLPLDLDTLGCRKQGLTMTWKDMRHAMDEDRLPKIPLTCPQATFMILEDFNSCWLGLAWYMICNVAIILNVIAIIYMSFESTTHEVKAQMHDAMDLCAYLFMFDYFLKAVTVIFCPIGMWDETYLLETVLPLGDNVEQRMKEPLTKTKFQRFWYWALCASNVIDFLSILPNVISLLFVGIHVPLSSLRMLRLLRVLRLLKAFKAVGKWVITLQVIGDAIFMSLGSILVIVLYIGLFSLVAGAVLYQQEGEEVYNDVPKAIAIVSEVFIGKCWTMSSTILSALVLAGVGVFKGIIFLLPMERMKAMTKIAEDKYAEKARLQTQVEEEARRQGMQGTEWAASLKCPTARFEVVPDAAPGGCGSIIPGIGMLNLPIEEKGDVEAVVSVPVHGGSMARTVGGHPSVEFYIKWRPEKPASKHPKGQLTVQILKGQGFNSCGCTGNRWRVRLSTPSALYGEAQPWLTSASDGQASSPVWSEAGTNTIPEGAVKTFDILWEVFEDEVDPVGDEKAFRKRVLDLLQEQSKRIAALEGEVKSLRK